jgi:hypothetical protein
MIDEYPSSPLTSVIDTPMSKTDEFLAPPLIRLIARLFATSLDEKLAAGEHAASSPLLAARSGQLVVARCRRGIADSWLDLLTRVRRRHQPLDPAVPPLRGSVLEAEDEIRSLAEALVRPLPTVRGVAMSIAMLRDGAGPLFNRNSQLKLTSAVDEIIALLDPLATATPR